MRMIHGKISGRFIPADDASRASLRATTTRPFQENRTNRGKPQRREERKDRKEGHKKGFFSVPSSISFPLCVLCALCVFAVHPRFLPNTPRCCAGSGTARRRRRR